jgi:hypothetical protein
MISPKTLPLPIGRDDGGGEQPQFLDRADDAADADEVAHLERPQHQHEGTGREVAEHAAPGHADGHAGTGDQRREAGGLHAEVTQDAEHQGDVQHHRDDRAEVLGQRRIDMVAGHRRLHEIDHAADQPAADDPEGDGRQDLDAQLDGRGA